jgi:hypothetical protein
MHLSKVATLIAAFFKFNLIIQVSTHMPNMGIYHKMHEAKRLALSKQGHQVEKPSIFLEHVAACFWSMLCDK